MFLRPRSWLFCTLGAYLLFLSPGLTPAPAGGSEVQPGQAQPAPQAPAQPSSHAEAVVSAKAPGASGQNVEASNPELAATHPETHIVERRENLSSLVRRYLPQTVFLTPEDLAAAIREANGMKPGKALRPGQPVIIPGIENAPIVEHPILVPKDLEIRAIYLTGLMAGHPKGIALIRRWRELGGNAVVFDVKDSDGSVNVPFTHPLAPQPLRPPIRDLPKFVHFLHTLGLHGIGRLALFRDELLVKRHPELAVRSRGTGGPWRENGKLVWADPSRPEVQDYNLALAKTAATAGVDEIQFDYVRFPAEGDQKDAQFFFQSQQPKSPRSQVITDFLERAYAQLRPLGVLFSLDVFGVMAWQRPADLSHTGQNIPEMARACDVLSPMVYPSHFFGMDGYAWPGDAPEHFIGESMDRFGEITAHTGVVLRPWLQAFGWRTKSYSPQYIRTQVSIAKQKGGIGFLFWNARNDYSKPFVAMPGMRAASGQFFRGDEIHPTRAEGTAAPPAQTPAPHAASQ